MLIIVAGIVALVWALSQFMIISAIPVRSGGGAGEESALLASGDEEATTARLQEIYEAIYEGAESFLRAEYRVCFWFVVLFAVLIFVLVSWGTGWEMARGSLTAISFLLGAFTSMASGYLGMKVAVYSNVRTTVAAQKQGWTECFNTAFRAGAVMGKFGTILRMHSISVPDVFVSDSCFEPHYYYKRVRSLRHGNAHVVYHHACLPFHIPQS